MTAAAILWIAVGLTALGLLVMLGAGRCMTDTAQHWPARFFDAGAAIFGLALAFWLMVAVIAFLGTASMHGA
ncbi:hypothetical protein [Sphingobium aromaticiconvertens]|uniref:hypothetical protein n=1 Tax=Sphingobium aromaticiconvertens TaxID=365341 RepID=UPI00301AF2E7